MFFVVTGANVVSNMGGVPGAEAARGFVNAVSSDVVTQAWPAIRPPPRMCDRAFLSIGPPPWSDSGMIKAHASGPPFVILVVCRVGCAFGACVFLVPARSGVRGACLEKR